MGWVKEYFTFTRGEQRGIIVLLFLIITLILLIGFSDFLFRKETVTDFSKFERELAKIQKAKKEEKNSNFQKSNTELFYFNPNHLTEVKWKLLGLKDWQIKKIYDYEKSGGTFNSLNDIYELKVFNGKMYYKLKKYFQFDTQKKKSENEEAIKIQKFYFNPNQLPEVKWKMLGLKDWQIKIIKKYEAKGGKFKRETDLKRIYGINENWYNEIKNYITIPGREVVYKIQLFASKNKLNGKSVKFKGLKYISSEPVGDVFRYYYGDDDAKWKIDKKLKEAKTVGFSTAFIVAFKKGKKVPLTSVNNQPKENNYKKKNWSKNKNIAPVELNGADTTLLKTVRGIGSSYAKRIVKYRDMLGGFISMDQLKEVYGIDEIVYDKIRTQLTLNPKLIFKININTCDFRDLLSHPYIKHGTASKLINYRDNHEDFERVEEIKKPHLVNADLYRKIAPYLKTE